MFSCSYSLPQQITPVSDVPPMEAKSSLCKAGFSVPDDPFRHGIANEVLVFNKVCASYQNALVDEVAAHWQDHLARNLSESATGAAFGYIACRVPRAAAAAALITCAQRTFDAIQHTTFLCDRAYLANTEEAQSAVAGAITEDLVQQSLHTLPTIGGLGSGYGIGRVASKRASDYWTRDQGLPDPLDSKFLRTVTTFPHEVRKLVSASRSDFFSPWHGPGSDQLPTSFKNEDGTHDLMAITKWLAEKHPWQGHEVSRFVRKQDLRASMFNEGTPTSVCQPKFNNEDVFDFHIHPPRGSGSTVPSPADQTVAKGFGIIQSGDRTTLYIGGRVLLNELKIEDPTGELLTGKYWFPQVIVRFDRQRRLASETHPSLNRDEFPFGGRPLDYDELERRLARFDGNWSTLRSIPTGQATKEALDFASAS